MPFDPSMIRRPQIDPDKYPGATRQDKVIALAQKLYERRLASSMADARRLAEGMVETEKKIVKSLEPKPVEQALKHVDAPKQDARDLKLSEDFAKFVAKTAAQSIAQSVMPRTEYKTESKAEAFKTELKPISYGREETKRVDEVPHSRRSNVVFFDDAPDLTKLRGYTGPKKSVVEYASQKMAEIKRPPMPEERPEQTESVTRVSAGDAGVAVTKVERSENVTRVTESVIVKDDLPMDKIAEPAEPVRVDVAPKIEPMPEVKPEIKPEPKPKVDLAKEHGVDIFEMFKKKG